MRTRIRANTVKRKWVRLPPHERLRRECTNYKGDGFCHPLCIWWTRRESNPSGRKNAIVAKYTLARHAILLRKMRGSTLYDIRQKRKCTHEQVRVYISFFGGPDGSRTRVRKPLDMTFSGCILSFRIPLVRRRQTGF